jgi:hypothetical protein
MPCAFIAATTSCACWTTVQADQIHAILGEASRALLQGVTAQILRRPIHCPEADRLVVRGMDKFIVARRDDTVFAGEPFVQPAKVNGTLLKRVGRRIKREPVCLIGSRRGCTEAGEATEHNEKDGTEHAQSLPKVALRANRFSRHPVPGAVTLSHESDLARAGANELL